MTEPSSVPARTPGRRSSTGSASGTAGEIVQGRRHGRPFLITLPVPLGSRAHLRCATGDARMHPSHATKSRRLTDVLRGLARGPAGCGCRDVDVRLESDLPTGAGMASSSADLVAVARAADAHWDLGLDASRIGELAASIEPTDGVMYDGPVVFDHIAGRLLSGPYPHLPCLLVVVDPGTRLDTVGFPRVDYTAGELAQIERAHDLAVGGLATGDLAAIGRAATRSARVNQRRQRKPLLERVVAASRRHGGVGVAVAHSGTVLAAIFDARDRGGAVTVAADLAGAMASGGRVEVLLTGRGAAPEVVSWTG